jgi:hypothetical protein
MKQANSIPEMNTINLKIESLRIKQQELTQQCKDFSSYIKTNNSEQNKYSKNFLNEKELEKKTVSITLERLCKCRDDLLAAIKSNNTEDIAKIMAAMDSVSADGKKKNTLEIFKGKLNKALSDIDLIDTKILSIESKFQAQTIEKQEVRNIDLQLTESLQLDIDSISSDTKRLSKIIVKYQNRTNNLFKKEGLLELIHKAKDKLEIINRKITQLNKDLNAQTNSLQNKEDNEQLNNDKTNDEDSKLSLLQLELKKTTDLYTETKIAKEILCKELEDLKNQYSTLTERINTANLTLQDNSQLLKRKDSEIAKLSDNLHLKTQVEKQLLELKSELGNKNDECIRLEAEKEHLSQELKKLKIEQDAGNDKENTAQALLREAQQKLEEVNAKTIKLQEDLSGRELIYQQNIHRITELEKQLSHEHFKDTVYQDLKSQITTLSNKLNLEQEEYKQQIKELGSELQTIRLDKETLITEIKNLEIQNLIIKEKKDCVTASLEEKERLLGEKNLELNNLSNTSDSEKAIYRQDIEKLKSERDGIIKKHEVIERKLLEFTSNLQNKNDQYSELKVEKENLSKELIALKTQLKNTTLDNKSLKKHIIKLTTKIKENEDKIKGDKNAHENEIAKLKEEKQEIEESYVMIKQRTVHLDEYTGVLSSDNGYKIVTIEQPNKSMLGKLAGLFWYSCCGIVSGPIHGIKSLFTPDNIIHYTVKENYTLEKDGSVVIGKDNSDADTNI